MASHHLPLCVTCSLTTMSEPYPPSLGMTDHPNNNEDNATSSQILAPISKLPPELLGFILSLFVSDSGESPVFLTEVCRHWRDVVRNSGQLWSMIDLGTPERAKHHLEFARGSNLAVIWLNRSGPGSATLAEHYQWIWEHSRRVRTFDLAHVSRVLQSIFERMDAQLPELVSLTLLGQDTARNLIVPFSIQNDMPRLTTLYLWCAVVFYLHPTLVTSI